VKYGSKLFFIDHLHFIVPFNSDRLDTRIGDTMRQLKTIAKKHKVIIVLVAHLKKTEVTIAPTLEDLRDSSFIAQEADTVMMLWRETKRENNEVKITNNTTLSVQANRRTGTTGTVKLTFTDGRFTETDWKHDDNGICASCGQSLEFI
jgi:replicative DNA helicase